MANTKHEDAIMKIGFGYFRDTILRLLGIEYEFAEIGPTELVELTIHSMYMDFTFLTTDGRYIHSEFRTPRDRHPKQRIKKIKRKSKFDECLIKYKLIYDSDC